MNSRLLLISQANSYRIAAYLKAGQHLGLDVVIASKGEHSLITEVHDGLHVDLENHDVALKVILEYAKETPLVGILGCDDSTVALAAMAASQLNLPHNPPEAANISHRKDLARESLSLADCAVPKHLLINLKLPLSKQTVDFPWPRVLKPLNMSASRGVIRVDDEDAFYNAVERIKKIIEPSNTELSGDDFEKNHLLVEEYIDGVEVAFEGYLYQGELFTLALFDKPDPLVGPYFDETIYVTPSLLADETQQLITQRVKEACQAYGLTTGPVHAELRIDDDNAWILEVASRTIGGDCGQVFNTGQNLSVEEIAITLSIGKDIETEPMGKATGVMMIPIKKAGLLRQVEGIEEARNVTYIDKVDIIMSYGHELVPLPEGNQYLGYIFASAKTSQQVIDALKVAYSKLVIKTAPLIALKQI